MKRLVLLLVLAACTKAALPTGEATACLSPQERGLVGQQLAIARAVRVGRSGPGRVRPNGRWLSGGCRRGAGIPAVARHGA